MEVAMDAVMGIPRNESLPRGESIYGRSSKVFIVTWRLGSVSLGRETVEWQYMYLEHVGADD